MFHKRIHDRLLEKSQEANENRGILLFLTYYFRNSFKSSNIYGEKNHEYHLRLTLDMQKRNITVPEFWIYILKFVFNIKNSFYF